MSIFTPVNQIRLTNVSVVRYKRKGKRFEVACYPNKVLSWRDGIEKEIDEVLQTDTIFQNVSKGIAAKVGDLKNCFSTDDNLSIAKIILEKGEVQTGGKERQIHQEAVFREIAQIVANSCIDINTNKPLTVPSIENAMKEIHYSVHPSKSAKQQSLDVIRTLTETLPIARAQMRLSIEGPTQECKRIKKTLEEEMDAVVESTEWGSIGRIICLIDPGKYRPIAELVSKYTRGKGEISVLATKITS